MTSQRDDEFVCLLRRTRTINFSRFVSNIKPFFGQLAAKAAEVRGFGVGKKSLHIFGFLKIGRMEQNDKSLSTVKRMICDNVKSLLPGRVLETP